MKNKWLVVLKNGVLLMFLGFMIAGCATEYTADKPKETKSSAHLTFTRPDAFAAHLATVPIYVNGLKIGKLGNNSTLAWSVAPGKVTVGTSPGVATFVFNEKAPASLTFNAQPGKTYNFKVWIPGQFRVIGKPIGDIAAEIAFVK